MAVEWKDITGFEGIYKVSNNGEVRSIQRTRKANFGSVRIVTDKLLKQSLRNGYLCIGLCMNGKSVLKSVHRLVAEYFIPNPENKATVNHKNGIKTDNRVENLEWATSKENTQHAHNNGLTSKGEKHRAAKLKNSDIAPIRELLNKGIDQSEIAAKFGVSNVTISDIKCGRSWSHIK